MKLEGIVRATEMPDIFHLLSASGREGVLVVSKGGARRRVYFGAEGVTLFFDSRRACHLLGQILVGRGIITGEILENALQKQQETGIPLGEILCNSGATRPEQVESALTYQLREELFDVLTWENARFQFLDNADRPTDTGRTYARTPSFNTDVVIMEAARRADEWHRIRELIPSEHVVLLKVPDAPSLDDELAESEVVHLVLDLATGTHSLSQMVETLRRSQFDVFEATHALLNAGAVKQADARELADLAAEALEEQKPEHARRVLLNASQLCGDDLELRYDLGTMLMWAGDEEAAEENLDILVRKLLEANLTGKIDQVLNHLRDEFPDKPYSYARRMKMLDPKQGFESAMTLARQLLAIYDERGDERTAKRMLRFLAKFQVSHVDELLRLARLLEEHGEVLTAARRYYTAANQLRYAGVNPEAVEFYRKAVALDPGLTAAREELDYLLTGKRRRRRRIVLVSVLACAVLMVFVAAWVLVVRERRARRALDDLDVVVSQLVANRQFDEAIAAYGGFLNDYRYTSVNGRAEGRLEEVRKRKEDDKAVMHNAARKLVHNAEEAERALELARAITNYRLLQELDFSDELVEKAGSNIHRLKTEQEDYTRLIEQARSRESAGRYPQALQSYLSARERSLRLFERDQLRLPLRIESDPPGAQVFRGEEVLGVTPVLIRRELDEAVTVVLRREGFYDTPLEVPGLPAKAIVRAKLIPGRKPLWTFRGHGAIDDTPQPDGNTYYLSTRQGRLYALRRDTGEKLWEQKLDVMPGSYLSAPLVLADRLIVVTMDGSLRAFSRDGRKELWHWEARTLVAGPPVYLPGEKHVVLTCADGKVRFIDAFQGRAARTVQLPGRVTGRPILEGGLIYYGTENGSIQAFDLSNRRPGWSLGVGASARQPLTCADGTLYVLLEGGEMLAVSAADGKSLWRCDTAGSEVTAPTADERFVFFGSKSGRVTALDAKTGRRVWDVQTDGAVTTAPQVDGERLYVATDNGKAMAFERTSGELLWKCDIPGAPAAPPMFVGDHLFFSTLDGALQAFAR